MFAENPNIFEEVKQKLAEISVRIPTQKTATRTRLQTPSAAKSTMRKPSNLSPMRQSARIATKQNQGQLSDSQPSTIDEVLSTTDMQMRKQEKQQERRETNKEKRRIQFEKDLESYMWKSREKNALFKDLPEGNVCKKCLSVKRPDDLVKCAGGCGNHVHRSCAHSTNLSTEVKCDECVGVSSPICYACRRTCSESMVRCSYRLCGRNYHNKCLLDSWPQTQDQGSGKVICPLHCCHTCMSDDPVNKYFSIQNAESTHCIRCPAAFHTNSNCIPAGVRLLTKNQHICIRHRSNGNRKSERLNWCYICSTDKRGKHKLLFLLSCFKLLRKRNVKLELLYDMLPAIRTFFNWGGVVWNVSIIIKFPNGHDWQLRSLDHFNKTKKNSARPVQVNFFE